jgi:hypothetical protein
MLNAEFKNAFNYTKGLLNTKKESLILFVLCLIPIINIFVIVCYVNKIVAEPSNTATPPKLENPNWSQLIISLLKIAAVAVVWVIIAAAIIIIFSLIVGAGLLGGIGGMMTLIEKFSAKSIIAATASIVVIFVVAMFALISEVSMIKQNNLNAAFNFKGLILNIKKITWPRYLLFMLTTMVTFGIVIRILMFIDSPVTICLAGILYILPVTFLAKTISVLYDKYNPPQII